MEKNQPRPAGVRSFLCREAYGLVFVFPGTVSRVNEIGLPNVSLADDPQYKTRYLDRQVGCHYSFMHENLMDMNHQFLHRRLMGGIRTVFLELRERPYAVQVDYTFSRIKGTQAPGKKISRKPRHQQMGQSMI